MPELRPARENARLEIGPQRGRNSHQMGVLGIYHTGQQKKAHTVLVSRHPPGPRQGGHAGVCLRSGPPRTPVGQVPVPGMGGWPGRAPDGLRTAAARRSAPGPPPSAETKASPPLNLLS